MAVKKVDLFRIRRALGVFIILAVIPPLLALLSRIDVKEEDWKSEIYWGTLGNIYIFIGVVIGVIGMFLLLTWCFAPKRKF